MSLKSCSSGLFKAVTVGVVCGALVGCSSSNERQRAQFGTVVGAVIGGVIGSKMGKGSGSKIMMVVGAAAGAILGEELARMMTEEDQQMATETMTEALDNPTANEEYAWQNPESGNSGVITVDETYVADVSDECRDFETTVFANGEEHIATGTACKDADGAWHVVKEPEA